MTVRAKVCLGAACFCALFWSAVVWTIAAIVAAVR